MKTLDTIQKLAKLGRILSKIAFVFSLVGAIGCAVGLLGLVLLPENLQLGDVTIKGLIETSGEVSMGMTYAAVATGLILCIGEAVLAKIAERYFRNELAAGTPFTFDGAKELKRFGIFAICIPIGTSVLSEIVYQVMAHFMQDVGELHPADSASIGLGIMLIVMSLMCKHGAELNA